LRPLSLVCFSLFSVPPFPFFSLLIADTPLLKSAYLLGAEYLNQTSGYSPAVPTCSPFLPFPRVLKASIFSRQVNRRFQSFLIFYFPPAQVLIFAFFFPSVPVPPLDVDHKTPHGPQRMPVAFPPPFFSPWASRSTEFWSFFGGPKLPTFILAEWADRLFT